MIACPRGAAPGTSAAESAFRERSLRTFCPDAPVPALARWPMLKALLWIVVIIFVIGLLVVFGIIDLIF